MADDLDVRPIPIDKLATFSAKALEDRHLRIEELCEEYGQRVERLQADLTEAQRVLNYLLKEKENVDLAQKLARGDVVRVVCPTCTGTGMKPADVMSGHVVKTGSAFEQTSRPTAAPVIDERNRCTDCKGARWKIMDRFKG
jgi:molybdopterin converting factor small subunit